MALDVTKNFAKVEVSTGYDASATAIVLKTGDGAKLPQPSTDGEFNLVYWDSTKYTTPTDDPKKEIVRVTARATDTLTIVRAQESTAASTKNTADSTYKMILALTTKMIEDIEAYINTDGPGDKLYGDGSDGALVASSGTTTLVRDMYYTNVTLSGTAKINASGFRIFVQGTLTIGASCEIYNKGNDGGDGDDGGVEMLGFPGSGGVGGVAANAGAVLHDSIAGSDGGEGGDVTGNGNPGDAGDGETESIIGANPSTAYPEVSAGGAGGGGGNMSFPGGSGSFGTRITATALQGFPVRSVQDMIDGILKDRTSFAIKYWGARAGAGGGGGGGGGDFGPLSQAGLGAGGGGGGSNGGPLVICAKIIINNGSINVNAGDGGDGGNGGNAVGTAGGGGGGGGGAGGNGGILILVYNSYSGSGTKTATKGVAGVKGTGGTGGSSNDGSDGNDGVDGSDGLVIEYT